MHVIVKSCSCSVACPGVVCWKLKSIRLTFWHMCCIFLALSSRQNRICNQVLPTQKKPQKNLCILVLCPGSFCSFICADNNLVYCLVCLWLSACMHRYLNCFLCWLFIVKCELYVASEFSHVKIQGPYHTLSSACPYHPWCCRSVGTRWVIWPICFTFPCFSWYPL